MLWGFEFFIAHLFEMKSRRMRAIACIDELAPYERPCQLNHSVGSNNMRFSCLFLFRIDVQQRRSQSAQGPIISEGAPWIWFVLCVAVRQVGRTFPVLGGSCSNQSPRPSKSAQRGTNSSFARMSCQRAKARAPQDHHAPEKGESSPSPANSPEGGGRGAGTILGK